MTFVDQIKLKFGGNNSAIVEKRGGDFLVEITSDGILAPIALKGKLSLGKCLTQ